jgi:His-Xaa-Ser system radical SAM maturase HxsC
MGDEVMLKLSGQVNVVRATGDRPYLVTVTRKVDLPLPLRTRYALLLDEGTPTEGFRTILLRGSATRAKGAEGDLVKLSADFDYLDEGDIIRLNPTRATIRTLYRRRSRHNTLLLTERCNHYCVMCSQPPKRLDDSWLLDDAFEIIRLIPVDTESIVFSGGEPTLYGERFIDLIRHTKRWLPRTSVGVLTNGRAFTHFAFAAALAAIDHPDCLVGIPIYSDDPVRHDYVVQSRGAFDETVRGILNLKRVSQKVEIRVVIHRETVGRLVETCDFIARNLAFVDHVALMGLEITGFTRTNLEALWIDPYDYKDVLSAAVDVLTSYGINVSVYNHQLCTVNSDILGVYRKSISDWKNEYVDECMKCSRRSDCGGFFSSSVMYRRSAHIRAFD